jgi:hypothetical protein
MLELLIGLDFAQKKTTAQFGAEADESPGSRPRGAGVARGQCPPRRSDPCEESADRQLRRRASSGRESSRQLPA